LPSLKSSRVFFLDETLSKLYDLIVIGSGCGGSAAAYRAASKGLRVLCLEAGGQLPPESMITGKTNWEISKMEQQLSHGSYSYPNNAYHLPIDTSDSPIRPINFFGVGGSTMLYSGHYPRFRPEDFQGSKNRATSIEWPISYDDLKPYFEIDYAITSVSGLEGDPYYPDIKNLLPPVPVGTMGNTLAKGFNALGWHWWPSYSAIATRDFSGHRSCANLGSCNYGCSNGSKSSSDISYLRQAKDSGVVLVPRAIVTRLISNGNRIERVEFMDESGSLQSVETKTVVLAAGALGSPRLLLNSATGDHPKGLSNRSGQVGRNLMLHPLGYAEGFFPNPMDSNLGPQGCCIYSNEFYCGIDQNVYGGYSFQVLRGPDPVEAMASWFARGLISADSHYLSQFEKLFNHTAHIAIIVEDKPSLENSIELDFANKDNAGMPGIKMKYSLSEDARQLLSHGVKSARQVLKASGAHKTYGYAPVKDTGWHQLGTLKMGKDPTSSVVNERGQSHDIPNLFVADSSVFVTSSSVNPASTIRAIALFVADHAITFTLANVESFS
jgi:choline dehydrogenase-like flavoprotein